MTYTAKEHSNSCFDSIRADIAEMLNLQQKIVKQESILMAHPVTYTDDQLRDIQLEYTRLSARFEDLKEKYNIN